ncbi:hypothetical protein [Enterobacter chengduensis]|uniref:hypothetical protein n=1 Tax=Enterobacter chengduensis TaxID=2494701 RepID=UPI0020052C82|nr:hypothetical protein [Enterobacter chengduensis]MCK7426953.1 hypothetical protein [Enterobacter chengduensis]
MLAGLGEYNPQNSWNSFQQAYKELFGDSTESAAAYKRLKEEQSPWPIGYEPTQREIQIGEQFNVAMSPDQKDIHPGNFGTFDEIISVDYVRNELAVKVLWKPEINRVTTYEVTHPFIIKEGLVAPQIDNGIYLQGGGSQLQMPFKYGLDDKMMYLKIISTKEIK